MSKSSTAWQNWAGNQTAHPVAIDHPHDEDELVAAVKQAAAHGHTVKAVGTGHSFTGVAVADGHLLVLDNYQRVLDVDTERYRVTVEAGIRLDTLNAELEARGLAMPNLGDIAYQTISGATSTATHGTGSAYPGLAAQIVALRIASADGAVISCSTDEEAEVFHAARVGVGALGILSTVTLQVVPAFHLHAVNEPMRMDEVLADLDALVDGNDHFEFFWVPHTGWALTKRNNRTTRPLAPRRPLRRWWDQIAMENVAFGAVCWLDRLRPQWTPRLAKALPSAGRQEFVEPSYRVFASPRLVRFYEMEYEIPREACAEALNRVRAFVHEEGLLLSFPVEVRFTAADDIPLSTGYGRPNAYIAVHVFHGTEYERYFRGVERIMDDYGGRPHWGKLHFQTAETLAPRYPEWERFADVRRRLDPGGRFANAYVRRALG
jgi:L-gulono-1,4-lactone dehydrogenase